MLETIEFNTQCKIRQCSECNEDTEFYCITCKHDLCLHCKERHVIDLDTICHDVIIYREQFDYIPTQEMCVRHQDKKYKKYCYSCRCPFCVKCKKHRKHEIEDVETAYRKIRQEQQQNIHNIRSNNLYNSCILLAGIKTDKRKCQTEISNIQSKMSIKAQRLKNAIDNEIYNFENKLKCIVIHRLQQKIRKMKNHLARLENDEHIYEHAANRSIKFLLFLKKVNVSKSMYNSVLSQHDIYSLRKEVNLENVIVLVSEIQIPETDRRQISYEFLLELVSTPVLKRSVKVRDVTNIDHISCVTRDLVWVTDIFKQKIILTNKAGDSLHHVSDISPKILGHGGHSVNIMGDLIFIDKNFNINKRSSKDGITTLLIKKSIPLIPVCLYCSLLNEDLLVVKWNIGTRKGKLTRYDKIHQVKHNYFCEYEFLNPLHITENHNGDVIVSDRTDFEGGVLVVIERGGKYRFSYSGPPSAITDRFSYGGLSSESRLSPQGVCTDALSQILVCDNYTRTVQMIDKDGHFILLIETIENEMDGPWSLSYDFKTHLLCVASPNSNRLNFYRAIKRMSSIK